ncbi:MAG TPA: 30S ribosomal protein S20 [Candidatus Dormibacteraeota bacterium]|nr:30S ribosomal protein S20 [Candidatus Dormibacteraeota bacterium]
MPNIKAAEKWARQSATRTERNKDTKTRLKTAYKKAVAAKDETLAKEVESEFDRAAKRGMIHPNKAARKKSRLAKAMKAVAVVPDKPGKSKAKPAKASATKRAAAAKGKPANA